MTEEKDVQATVLEGELLTPTPPIGLHNVKAVRREMASVYRDMRTGRIDVNEGTKLVYALDRIREAFKTEELDTKLQVIESTLKLRNQK